MLPAALLSMRAAIGFFLGPAKSPSRRLPRCCMASHRTPNRPFLTASLRLDSSRTKAQP